MSSAFSNGVSSSTDSRPARDSETFVMRDGDTDPSRRNRPHRLRSRSIEPRKRGNSEGHPQTVGLVLLIGIAPVQGAGPGCLATLARPHQGDRGICLQAGAQRGESRARNYSCILENAVCFAREFVECDRAQAIRAPAGLLPHGSLQTDLSRSRHCFDDSRAQHLRFRNPYLFFRNR